MEEVILNDLEWMWYEKLMSFHMPQDMAIDASRDFAGAGLCPDKYTNLLQLRDGLKTMGILDEWILKIQQLLGLIKFDIVLIVGGAIFGATSGMFPEKYKKYKIIPKLGGLGLIAAGAIGAIWKAWPIFFPSA